MPNPNTNCCQEYQYRIYYHTVYPASLSQLVSYIKTKENDTHTTIFTTLNYVLNEGILVKQLIKLPSFYRNTLNLKQGCIKGRMYIINHI